MNILVLIILIQTCASANEFFIEFIADDLRVPVETMSSMIDSFCQNIASLGLKPRDSPNITEMNFILKTGDHDYLFPLEYSEKLWAFNKFNHEWPLVLVITGWKTNFRHKQNKVLDIIYEAYRCRGEINFVTFDTKDYVDSPFYLISAMNTEEIGRIIANSLVPLLEKYSIENIHLIGHSLGAHIAGSVGRHIYSQTKNQMPRIIGLDPAKPCFDIENNTSLSRQDGKFVMVIHSNSGLYGKRAEMGHVDFYPNGIEMLQPGCSSFSCAHRRAVDYFSESVYPGNEYNFPSKDCQSWRAYMRNFCRGKQSYPMGYSTPANLTGILFLRTNAKSAYGLNATNNFKPACKNTKPYINVVAIP